MPQSQPLPLVLKPGVVKTQAQRVVEGRYTDLQWVRFVAGLPQKMGGWLKQTTALASGMIRALHAWRDLSSLEYMAAGTYKKLYVYERDFTQHDVTPLAATGTLGNNPFTTTNGSAIVSVSHANHGRNSGDTVVFSGATTTAGLNLNGTFTVLTVTNANAYTFTATGNANASTTGGGAAVAYSYEVSVGVERGVYGLGYGVGGYGLGTYGTARSSSTIFIEPRIWSFDHFGQILLSSYNGGTIYKWDPSVPGFGRASVITADAALPTNVRHMFITDERFVFALCEAMVVNWCTQGDYTVWTPATGNTANSRTLQGGTKLIAGRTLGNRVCLVWSDFALFIFQYTGSSSVYASRKVGENCGLVSPSAAITANGNAYWMGHKNFFYYNGAVQPIPNVNDVRDFIFGQLTSTQGYLCWGQYLDAYNEAIWFWVANADNEPSYYAIVNLDDFSWSTGQLIRSAGTKFSHGDTSPYFAGTDGNIYFHEQGHDADGVAIEATLTTGPSALKNGAVNYTIDGFNADFKDQAGDVLITLNAYDRLNHSVIDSETITIAPTDDLVDCRVGGRYISLTLVSNTVGGYFRFGKPDVFITPNGNQR